jgi:hypothetical protein
VRFMTFSGQNSADHTFAYRTGADLPRPDDLSECLPCWERLERIDWKAGLAFESHGARFGIRANDPAILPRIAGLLPPGAVPLTSPLVEGLYSLKVAAPGARAGVRNYHLLYQGVGQIARTQDLDEALAALESDLHGQVASRAQDSLFVHAGVVGWQGRAIVIPGRSFSGKTSLTAALVRAGAEYLSDEYAVLDTQGRVHPYPKSLSFRDAAGEPLEKRSVESLGGRAAAAPLPVGLILDTKYVQDAHWRPRHLTPGAALFTLLDNTVQIRRQPQWALEILQKAVSGAAGVKSKRGEAEAVAAWALNHLSAEI